MSNNHYPKVLVVGNLNVMERHSLFEIISSTTNTPKDHIHVIGSGRCEKVIVGKACHINAMYVFYYKIKLHMLDQYSWEITKKLFDNKKSPAKHFSVCTENITAAACTPANVCMVDNMENIPNYFSSKKEVAA